MPDIYVTNQNAEYEYGDVSRYLGDGQVVYMTRGFVQVKGHEERLLKLFSKYFATAKPDDLLLLSGPAVLCSIATIAWARCFDGVTFLYNFHEKRNGKIVQVYQPACIAPED